MQVWKVNKADVLHICASAPPSYNNPLPPLAPPPHPQWLYALTWPLNERIKESRESLQSESVLLWVIKREAEKKKTHKLLMKNLHDSLIQAWKIPQHEQITTCPGLSYESQQFWLNTQGYVHVFYLMVSF